MLKISWKDSVKESKTDVLKIIREKEPRFYRKIARQKLTHTGQILRGTGGRNALVILEGKIKVKNPKGRLKRGGQLMICDKK